MRFALTLGCVMAMLGPADRDSAEEKAVTTAREYLAQRLKVDPQALTLGEVSATEWPDRSLGCREKGMVYAQVVTAGHRVILRSGEQSYEVHVAGEAAVMCGQVSPANAGLVANGAKAYALARRDLASRLGIALKGITGSWKVVAGPDAVGACGAKASSEASNRPRFAVKLEAGGKTYRYDADAEHAVACSGPGH